MRPSKFCSLVKISAVLSTFLLIRVLDINQHIVDMIAREGASPSLVPQSFGQRERNWYNNAFVSCLSMFSCFQNCAAEPRLDHSAIVRRVFASPCSSTSRTCVETVGWSITRQFQVSLMLQLPCISDCVPFRRPGIVCSSFKHKEPLLQQLLLRRDLLIFFSGVCWHCDSGKPYSI